MRRVRARGLVRAVLVALAVVAIVYVFRGPIVRGAACALLGVATGERVTMDALDVSGSRVVIHGLALARGPEPFVRVDTVDVRYDLHALVFGSATRRYGLEHVSLDEPTILFTRRADGSFDVPGGSGRATPGTSGATAGTPLRFTLDITGGSLGLDDPNRVLPVARRLRFDLASAQATVDTGGVTRVRAGGWAEGDPTQRLELAGRLEAGGETLLRWRGRNLDLPPVVDYFINSPAAALVRGRAVGLDVVLYAFPGTRLHLAGSASVTGGALRIPGLAVGARDMHGRLDLTDDAVVSPRLDARLGNVGVRLAGGLYGLGAPAFRLGVTAASDLGEVRGLFRFSQRLPLRGAATVATLLEGPVGAPLVATRVASRAFAYGRFPVSAASGRAIFAGGFLGIVGVRAAFGGLAIGADGGVRLGGEAPATTLVVDARGPTAGLPYVAQIAPVATVHATALVAGAALRLDARGVGDGKGGGVRLAGLFHVDPEGDGAFGPVRAERDDGSRLAGTLYVERSHSTSGFWVDARDYPFADLGTRPRLPGVDLVAPVFAGRLDGAVAGVGPPSAFRLAGRVRARALRVGPVTIDRVAGDVAGAFGNVRLGDVVATAPWGRFRGDGTYTGGRLALRGSYDGSLERLARLTGDLGGAGAIAGPVALLVDPHRVVVQTTGAASAAALVRGVPVDGVAGTLAVAGRSVRVYAAVGRVAGGPFAAAGETTAVDGAGVSVSDANLARVRSGLAAAGDVEAIGTLSSRAGRTRFRGGVAVARGVVASLAVAGNGDVAFDGRDAAFGRTDALAAGAFGSISGRVLGFGGRTPGLDLRVAVPSASLAAPARLLAPAGLGIAGTVGADMHVGGTLAQPLLDGDVRIPEGSVRGLDFSEGAMGLTVDARGIRVRDGRVRVGSTVTAFAARYDGDESALGIHAASADLADFNDLFDTGDTFGGRGRVGVRFSQRRNHEARTDADIAIAGLHYRRFDLGDARAAWQSRGRNVTGSFDFGGPSGHLAVSGTLELPVRAPLRELALRSRFDGRANLRGLDLGVWLPAVGLTTPVVGGRVDAVASIAGPLRDPAVTTTATLVGGSIGKFPIDRLTLEATSGFERTSLRRLTVELPSVTLSGTGAFGVGEHDPVALVLHAESPSLGVLSTRLFGGRYPIAGSGTADLTVGGTRANPRIAGSVALADATLRGVSVPSAAAAFAVRDRNIVVRDATVRFATGSLSIGGTVPFESDPYAIGPTRAAVGLTLAATDVDLNDFAPLLPAGSRLRGRVDGTISLDGTAGAPRLHGQMALANGSVTAPFETVPLTDVGATLRFDGDTISLAALHAAAGGGTLDAGGSVRVADLERPSDVAYDVVARADRLHLDLPAYGSGTLVGTLGVSRGAGGTPLVAGDLQLSDGTIPFNALLLAGSVGAGGGFDATAAVAAPPATTALGAVAFNLDLSADRNVRVRSANVDIGARGALHVKGSVAAPSLEGDFTSTGGTITYFNTVFRLIDGTVTFVPDLGLIPTLDARAITHVIDPDPNTVRNSAGTADVTLTLAGPVNALTIGLSSDPSYERQQILGLLLNAPALGASSLFGTNREQATLFGSNDTANVPPGVAVFRSQTGELSVAQEAFGVANAQFTRTLLAPFETTFANAVGLSNFNVNVDLTGNVGVSARKILGKKINAVYGSTFGYPYRQTFGFEFKPSDLTAAQVTVFESLGLNGLNSLTPTTFTNATNARLGATQPSYGTAGFSISLQHLF